VSSLLPPTIPYGVFLGQLHRGYRISSTAFDFLEFATDLWRRLVANGCSATRLSALFLRFTQRVGCKFRGWGSIRLLRHLRLRVAAAAAR
jgi:hypothetical protein